MDPVTQNLSRGYHLRIIRYVVTSTVQLLYNYQTPPALNWDHLEQTGKNGIFVHLPKGYFKA